jgi:lysophospholipase L1-like esterase
MRRVLPALALAACVCCAVTGCTTPTATAPQRTPAAHPTRAAPVSYYLALGDSLAQGVQPNSKGVSVETRDGYANQLYTMLRRRQPGLRLVKLGCPGETTGTMLHGGICSYPGGSQLAAAVRFLRAHRAHVSLITVDIGANDPDSCINQPSIRRLTLCAAKSIPGATANLAEILTRLRQADPKGRIIAMNYYLPELAEWRLGLAGQEFARIALPIATDFNRLLTGVYDNFGVRVANVFSAFHTADFSPDVTVPGFGTLPRNVATICKWTWECAPPPRGPNEHANRVGYQVIARAFLLADTG